MLTSGDHLGPYRIDALVGQGGMGQVYRAFDERLERTVALKVLTSHHEDSTSRARHLREARAAASLSHPNVVGVFDVGEADGRLYLAMEFVEGATLRAFVGQTALPWPKKVRWLLDVARALAAAHDKGIVHRDVKPENVIVRDDGLVKVLDFGIARRAAGGPNDATSRNERHETVTQTGSIAGTPLYMAPEQLRGQPADARSDQFAWAVSAYEVLTGRRPWGDGQEVFVILTKVLTEPMPSLHDALPDLPVAVEDILHRAASKEAEDRFPTMSAVADALEPFAAKASAPGISSPSLLAAGSGSGKGGPEAFAATTRVPTTRSTSPSSRGASSAPPGAATPRTDLPLARRAGDATASEPSHGSALAQLEARPRGRLGRALGLALVGLVAVGAWAAGRGRGGGPRVGPDGGPTFVEPVSDVPEAERAFKEGAQLYRDGAVTKATRAFELAVEKDPELAAAHLWLAVRRNAVDLASAQAHFQLAFQHRAHLDARGAALLEAAEAWVRPRPDLDEWETRLLSTAYRFPKDAELYTLLGEARAEYFDFEDAKAAFEAALGIDARFAPALAGLARAHRELGESDLALAATARCLEASPIASVCAEARFRIAEGRDACGAAREEATRWTALEPTSPAAQHALASSLLATGAPRPSVDEVLARKWSLVDADTRPLATLRDEAQLLALEGRLDEAVRKLEAVERELGPGADAFDHARPLRQVVALLREVDDTEGAARVARSYLDRSAAWAPYPLAPDPSISFLEALFRRGELDEKTLDERRTTWLSAEEERTRGDAKARARLAWIRWGLVYGDFAETREEAEQALARVPADALPPPERRDAGLEFAIGRAHALAGRCTEAEPALERVTKSCAILASPALVVRASYYLGNCREARGDVDGARRAYQTVVDRWGGGDGRARTLRAAKVRLAILARR